jgi:ankyrin repeat protein
MHSLCRATPILLLGHVLHCTPAEAARLSPACAGLMQRAAAVPAEDVFQANLLLFPAASAGCEDIVRDLLDHGVAIDARDRLGRTALALAAKGGRERIAELLIDRGAAIDAPAISGATPLFFAAEADHLSVAKVLLARGAGVKLTGAGGLTPLMTASFDASGKGAIVYAASRGFTPVVARLLDAGVEVNRRYEHGLSALMWAAGYADGAGVEDIKQVLALLIARGAALDARDDRGLSAHEIARDLGHREIADYLAAQSPAR